MWIKKIVQIWKIKDLRKEMLTEHFISRYLFNLYQREKEQRQRSNIVPSANSHSGKRFRYPG